MPNVAVICQCHLCGRVVFGYGPLTRHQKSCKRKMCEACDLKETCPAKLWFQDCPKIGDYWIRHTTREKQ